VDNRRKKLAQKPIAKLNSSWLKVVCITWVR